MGLIQMRDASLRRPFLTPIATAIYTLATATTRNPAVVLAAGAMGTLLALQRGATGGLKAPVLTQLAWSALMVCHLPRLFVRCARRVTRCGTGCTSGPR